MMKLTNILYKKLIMEGQKENLTIELLRSLIKGTKFGQPKTTMIAGGFVRDEILGKPSKDIDIVVALPNGGVELSQFIAKKLGIYKEGTNPVTYPKFGTAMLHLDKVTYKGIRLDGIEVEFVMTRKEQYHDDSRKPDVSYGTLAQDVERRDFTVNSLLKDLTNGEILDLTGMGYNDIKNGIVRTPLNPDIIFTEDPLRMLRCIRFCVKYNWNLPMFMIRALKKNAHQLEKISAERIQSELNKILISDKPTTGIRLLQITGLTKYIMPELDELVGLKQNRYHKDTVDKHVFNVIKNVPPDLITRISALMHDIGKARTKTTDTFINCQKCHKKIKIDEI